MIFMNLNRLIPAILFPAPNAHARPLASLWDLAHLCLRPWKWKLSRPTERVSWAHQFHFTIGGDGQTHVEICCESDDTAKSQ